MEHKVYLDHHTASCPRESVLERAFPFWKERWGDLSSLHAKGQELISDWNHSIRQVVQHLGAREEDLFYVCASGAEAISSVYLSHYFHTVRITGQNHILITAIEEAPIEESLKRLEELGCSGRRVSVNAQGQITRCAIEEALRPRTGLVSIAWANGLTGVVHPIADIADLCQTKGIALHIDASYAIGKVYIHFKDLPVQFLTLEGQLIHSLKGTGGVLVKQHTVYSSLVTGGPSTCVGSLVALAQALEEQVRWTDHICLETARLRDQLEQTVKQHISDVVIFGQEVERLPNCSAMGFPGVSSEALLYLLNRKKVYATMGGQRTRFLSEILIASGVDAILAHSAISLSLSWKTTEEEIDYAARMIIGCVQQLQKCTEGIPMFHSRSQEHRS